MSPPQWAYQVENFVNKPDEELVCSICHAVFCDPVICPCDHVFCKVCISKWLQSNRNCPICRNRVPRFSVKQMVPIVKNLIMKLVLYCKNKEHGCEAHFTIEGCESHMKECNFQLVQCKNKPCNEKLLRKDIVDHETNSCQYRYIKCEKCGQKMPLTSSPRFHNCVKALHMALKRKNNIIHKKNNEIQELKNEIKTLKEASHDAVDSVSPQSSTLSNLSPDEIMINIAEIEDMSSDSSDNSIIAIFSNSPLGRSSNDNAESESVSVFMRNQDSPELEYPRNGSLIDSSEYQNDESQVLGDTSYNQENDSLINSNQIPFINDSIGDVDSEREEQSQTRRPAKRRLPPLINTSDEDNNEAEGHPSLPSPKRCWRLQPVEVNKTTEGNTRESANSYMDAGPSSSSTPVSERPTSIHDSTKNKSSSKTKLDQRHTKEENSRKVSAAKAVPSRGNAVFERTLALLEQYSLESDSEWLPEYASHRGDTTSESDCSSYEVELRDDSSDSASDSDDFYGDASNAAYVIGELHDDTISDEDPDWHPH